MTIEQIKTPDDILNYMNENITYGYVDIDGKKHISLHGFRPIYRTQSVQETIKSGLGTCIEQVNLMHYLLDKLGIKSEIYCTRLYEPNDFNNDEAEEHLHCFLLYFIDDKVYQIEHPDFNRIGIYGYENKEYAIKEINTIYEKRLDGKVRAVTMVDEIKPGLSFKEFNNYVNDLDLKMNIILKEPKLDEYWYEEQLLNDEETMSYNAGWDVSYDGYCYDIGCIKCSSNRKLDNYHKRLNNDKIFFSYVVRKIDSKFVGTASFHYDEKENKWDCGIVIQNKYRGHGYGKEALKMLIDVAFNKYGVPCLYDDFEVNRPGTKMFYELGFVNDSVYKVKRFHKETEIVKIRLDKAH